MNQLFGSAADMGWIALKALLLYLTAVAGFRLGERRTLAEMPAFDFVAAVAVGAIVGRVPNSSTTSYLAGAATLVTIIIAHRILSRLRYFKWAGPLLDHPPTLLVLNGRIDEQNLEHCGLTRDDLYGILRTRGVSELRDVAAMIFEQRGKISIVRRVEGGDPTSELVKDFVDRTHR